MTTSIQFIKQGRDSFIDFLKAYCIICVILAHSLPSQNAVVFALWGGMQVPIFLLIQTFHGLKTGTAKLNWGKIAKKIIIPFFLVELVLLAEKLLKTNWSYNEVSTVIKGFIHGGGFGAGSYYFWIYLQFAIIIPFISPIFSRWSKQKLLLFFIILCVCGEILCSLIQMPEFLYRLLALRYIFLIFLGYLWVKDGIVMNVYTFILSILSMGSIIFFVYTDYNLEPFFFQTAWKAHHWTCYFYASNLLTFILYHIYLLIQKHAVFEKALATIGKASWEIFLMQMCVFSIPKRALSFIENQSLQDITWIIFTLILSIILGLIMHKLCIRFDKLCFSNHKD